jgi:hypothetical protein
MWEGVGPDGTATEITCRTLNVYENWLVPRDLISRAALHDHSVAPTGMV